MKFDIIETLTDIDDEFIASAKPAAQRPVEIRPEPRRGSVPIRKRFIAAAACTAAAAAALLVFVNVRGGQGEHVLPPADNVQDLLEHTYSAPSSVLVPNIWANNATPMPIFDKSKVDPTFGLDIGKAVEGSDYVFEVEEFPGESFRVTYDGKIYNKDGRAVIDTPELFNGFLYDYNEDGKRDICVTAGFPGAYYVEVYDIENDRNRYSYSPYRIKTELDENGHTVFNRYICNPYWRSRFIDVFYTDTPYIQLAVIENGKTHWYSSLSDFAFYDEKPVYEEVMLVCDCTKLSSGEEYEYIFDEYSYMRLCLKKTEKGAELHHLFSLFYGSHDNLLLNDVQNVYLYDSDRDGKREVWMTYLDGDRSAVAALIPGTEYDMYFSKDDGYQRSLSLEGSKLKIAAEPVSGGEPVTEPLDLSQMTKRIITPEN